MRIQSQFAVGDVIFRAGLGYRPQELILQPLPLGFIDSLPHLDPLLLFENLVKIRKYVGKSVIFC